MRGPQENYFVYILLSIAFVVFVFWAGVPKISLLLCAVGWMILFGGKDTPPPPGGLED